MRDEDVTYDTFPMGQYHVNEGLEMMPSKLPESVSYLHVHCFHIYIIKLIGIRSCVETGEYSGWLTQQVLLSCGVLAG